MPFKDLRPIKGMFYIRRLIAEGEHEQQDFKFAISDARKIARSISAFANNSGGRLLVGVKDNGAVAGVRSEEDLWVIEEAATRYCRPAQEVEAQAFRVEDGAVVVRVTIERAHERPVMVLEEGGPARAYFRVADENIAVPSWMVRAWCVPSGQGEVMALNGVERSLLDLIVHCGPLDLDQAVRCLHVATSAAERAAGRLYRFGLIDFAHGPGGFRMRVAEP